MMDEQCEHIALSVPLAAKSRMSAVEFITFTGLCCASIAGGSILALDRYTCIGELWKWLLIECDAYDGNVEPIMGSAGLRLVYMSDDCSSTIDAIYFKGDARYPGLALSKALLHMWGWGE